AGNGVLFDTECGNKKAMNYILRAQGEICIAVSWQEQRRCDDVIIRVGITPINSKRIAFRRILQFRTSPTEFSIRPGIAEVPAELDGIDFNLHRVFGSGCALNSVGPKRGADEVSAEEENSGDCHPDEFGAQPGFGGLCAAPPLSAIS